MNKYCSNLYADNEPITEYGSEIRNNDSVFENNDIKTELNFPIDLSESYLSSDQNNCGIFSKIALSNINSTAIRKQITDFLLQLQHVLETENYFYDGYRTITPLSMNVIEDGSVLIEWAFKDFRIGFSFEENSEESSYYFVTNSKLGEMCNSGLIKSINIEILLHTIILFVSRHT